MALEQYEGKTILVSNSQYPNNYQVHVKCISLALGHNLNNYKIVKISKD